MSRSRRSSSSRKRGASSSRKSKARSSRNHYSVASSGRFTMSSICSLIMPVARIKGMLKVHNYAKRVGDASAVFLTSVLEYVMTEILEMSLNAALSRGSKRIHAKHINLAIKTDPEFMMNFRNASVVEGGHTPFEHDKYMRLTNNVPLHLIMGNSFKKDLKRKSGSHKSGSTRRKRRRR